MITAFASLIGLLQTCSNKVHSLLSLFPLLSSWDHDTGIVHREHMEKAAHWACKRANDLIYKGAFTQQSNLDWLYSTFSISSSGHILPSFMSRETDKIKDKRKVERPRLVRRPLTLEGAWFGMAPVGPRGQELNVVRVERQQRGPRRDSASVPRASSLHHPKSSD